MIPQNTMQPETGNDGGIEQGNCKTWTLDSGLDHGLDYGLDYGLDLA